MDDIIKSVHSHKLAQEQHVENMKAEMRGEDISKGSMTAGNIHSTKKKDAVVKKNISEMTGESRDYSEKTDALNKLRDPDGIEKSMSEAYEALGVLPINLEKGKKVPVGTVSGGYKKVSEGKWTKVKEDGKKVPTGSSKEKMDAQKKIKEEGKLTDADKTYFKENKKEIMAVLDDDVLRSPKSAIDEHRKNNSAPSKELVAAFDSDVKDYMDARGMLVGDAIDKVIAVYKEAIKNPPKKNKEQYVAEYKQGVKYLEGKRKDIDSKAKKKDSSVGKKSGSGRNIVATQGSTDVGNITDKYTYMKRDLEGVKGKVDFVVTERDTKGMKGSQDQFMIEIHQNGKFLADHGTVPSDPRKIKYDVANNFNKKK